MTTANRPRPPNRTPPISSRLKFVVPPLRLIPRRSLRACGTSVATWAQMVPHLVTWRRFVDPLLTQSIVVYLGQPRTLDGVLQRFADHDRAMTEAALYSLVANGRVLSDDLATSLLSGSTRFRRV